MRGACDTRLGAAELRLLFERLQEEEPICGRHLHEARDPASEMVVFLSSGLGLLTCVHG